MSLKTQTFAIRLVRVFQTLTLNRARIVPEKKGEVINGWTIIRYRFFMSVLVFLDRPFPVHGDLFFRLDDLGCAKQVQLCGGDGAFGTN